MILALLMVGAVASAGTSALNRLHEHDIAGPAPGILATPPLTIQADRIEARAIEQAAAGVSVWVQKNGERLPVPGLQALSYSCGKLPSALPLENKWFSVKRSGVYKIALRLECRKHLELVFQHDSLHGKVVALYRTAAQAQAALAKAGVIGFWKSQVIFQYPSSADYYNYGTVHISEGHHWDVVAHELGHAVYDQARIGEFGGGSHKIDECYGNTIALSEGWATFFAGWVHLDLDDRDAKFEYLVPRRAPIRLENVPKDVCRQTTNEWRVSSYLWDVIDTNDDGESSAEGFVKMWRASLNGGFRSIREMHDKFLGSGFNREKLQASWQNNF